MALEFAYGRGSIGTSVKSYRMMAACLHVDLVNMNERWGIDAMTIPIWSIVDGNVEVKFSYTSAKYKEQLQKGIGDEAIGAP